MKRITIILSMLFMVLCAPPARAQFATFDASNLAQAVLSFLQDGDNMVLNTEQFLENLGVAKAKNYEQMARMFTGYVNRMKSVNGQQLTYYQTRSMVNEGFQYLLYASREVKRAREFLDKRSQISEEERLKGLNECDRQISRANAAMYYHIRETYEDLDTATAVAEGYKSLEEAFTIKY